MNDSNIRVNRGGTATVILLSFLLFYLPSVLAFFNHNGEPAELIVMSVVMATLYTVVFCINYFWLVPAMLIDSNRRAVYFLANLIFIALACSLIPLWYKLHGQLPGPPFKRFSPPDTMAQIMMIYLRFMIRDGVMMVLAAGLAYALRLSSERENVRRRELELNAERRHIELMSLKAQLNPHFLFNSLNNIYALIGFAPDKAQKALHELSNLLRFMIYDSTAPCVPLAKELSFIGEYVELMKLRLSGSVVLRCDIIDNPPQNLFIAPLLFLTVIENAFKHHAPNPDGNFITISITIEGDNLVCDVINSYSEIVSDSVPTEKKSGVGIDNVKRQLGLIYPGRHTFAVIKTPSQFGARLTISLDALSGKCNRL